MNESIISFDDYQINLNRLFKNHASLATKKYSPKLLSELDLMFNNLPVAANIFDHELLCYTYCNENLCSLMGYSREQFLGQDGMLYVYKTFLPTHIAIYNNYLYPKVIETMAFAVKNNEDVKTYKFNSTFRAVRSSGETFWCQVQFGVVQTNSDGTPMYTISLLNDISYIKKDSNIDFLIFKTAPDELQQTILYTSFNEDNSQFMLSKREIEVLRLVKSGHTSKSISDQLFLSENTVNTHRKNMLKKTNCKNMAELIHFANMKNIT